MTGGSTGREEPLCVHSFKLKVFPWEQPTQPFNKDSPCQDGGSSGYCIGSWGDQGVSIGPLAPGSRGRKMNNGYFAFPQDGRMDHESEAVQICGAMG